VTADTVIDGEKKDDNGRIITSDTQGWNRFAYVRNNPIIYKDPTGHKLYNVAIEGGGINVAGHNLTLHVDDKTGKKTYYEATGPNTKDVHVYARSEKEFKEHYKDRLKDTFEDKKFNATKSSKGYEVVEVKGVDEKKTLGHLNKMAKEYGVGKKEYPYNAFDNNCAKFSNDAYKAGGKEMKSDPKDFGENPNRYPRDLNQAIEYQNSKTHEEKVKEKLTTNKK